MMGNSNSTEAKAKINKPGPSRRGVFHDGAAAVEAAGPSRVLAAPEVEEGAALYEQGVEVHERASRLTEEAQALFKEARDLYQEAARKGYGKASTSLGVFALEHPHLVDSNMAVSYLEQGAAAGHWRALYNLGKIYEKGEENIPRNLPHALDYYRRAWLVKPDDQETQQKIQQKIDNLSRLLGDRLMHTEGYMEFSKK